MKHLPIGGSTINRTICCPQWINESRDIKRREAGNAANLGNLLHDCMEEYYKLDVLFEEQIKQGRKFADQVLTDEHLPILYQMRTAVEDVFDTYDVDEILLEPFVELIPDEAGGSIDMLALSRDRKTIITLDYKTGVGVVRAEQNKQLQFYTLCAKNDPKTKQLFTEVENYVGAIVQPRVFGNRADIWEYDNGQLDHFTQVVGKAIERTTETTKPVAGSHCMYCPSEPFCLSKKERAASALLLSPKKHETMNESVELAIELKSWCERVLETATEYAEAGVTLDKHKLVRGRSLRKWSDEKEVAELIELELGAQAYTSKLLSPAQAMKKLHKSDIADTLESFIVKPEGKLQLVDLADPREAVVVDSAQEKLNKLFDKDSVK